jgi:hypothetical protein
MGAAGIVAGTLFRSINKAGRIWGSGFSPKVIWGVVKQKAKDCEIPCLAPHDLRRTCARLCHQAGGELEQIQFLLGHVSVQTTERYLGCKQRFRNADWPGTGPAGIFIDTISLAEISVLIRSSISALAILHHLILERGVACSVPSSESCKTG